MHRTCMDFVRKRLLKAACVLIAMGLGTTGGLAFLRDACASHAASRLVRSAVALRLRRSDYVRWCLKAGAVGSQRREDAQGAAGSFALGSRVCLCEAAGSFTYLARAAGSVTCTLQASVCASRGRQAPLVEAEGRQAPS